MGKKKKIVISVIITIYIVFLTSIFDWDIKIQAISLLFISQFLWMSRVLNVIISSFVILLLLSFHFYTFEEAVQFIGTEIVWLLFSTYIIAGAFLKCNLSLRISLHILKLSRGNGRLLLLNSLFMMSILALLIPTNVGRANLIVTVMVGILKYLEKVDDINNSNIGKSLMIALNYFIIVSGTLIVTGSNSSIYAYGVLRSVSALNWSYLNWFLLFAPPVFLFLFALWGVLMWLFPIGKIDELKVINYIDTELTKLGKLSKAEKKLMIIGSFVITMWLTSNFHPYSIPMIGMIGAVLTLLPTIGVWSWPEAKNHIDWETLIFFATSLAVAGMLMKSGVLETFSVLFIEATSPIEMEWIKVLLLSGLAIIIRMIFLNVIGYMTIMLPLTLLIGNELSHISPVVLTLTIFLLGNPGFFFITQTPVNMITYQYGYYKEYELFKAGAVSSFVLFIIVTLTAILYWSHLNL